MDLAGSMLGWPDRRTRGAFGYVGPQPRAAPHWRRTRLGEVLVVQVTKFDTLSLFGKSWIARSLTRTSSVTSLTSLLPGLRSVSGDQRQLLAATHTQVLEVSLAALSGKIGGPS